jgi:hypothetical protein
MGQFKDSKWSRHKIETFRGARDFFGPLNGTSDSEGYFFGKDGAGGRVNLPHLEPGSYILGGEGGGFGLEI